MITSASRTRKASCSTPSSRSSIAAARSRDRDIMSDLRDDLYSLLVPLAGERLIVPRACVAEVIGYQPPAEMTNAPPWYVGLVSWGGRSVPIVSFEGAFGQPLPSVSSRTRIVIFHASSGMLPAGYF